MARQREYDADAALEGLVAAFLEKGFADTSLVDLEEASGLDRRQLYNDFGNKHEVFQSALREFSEQASRQFLARLEQGERGVQDVSGALLAMVDLAETPQGRLGCLVCNTARETVAHDPAVARLVDAFFKRIERAYAAALKRAEQRGELAVGEQVRSLARFFFGIHVSVCVLARGGASRASLRDIVTEALRRIRV